MIYLLWLVGYLVFGFALIGFLVARDKSDESLDLAGYVFMSVIWPFSFAVWLYCVMEAVGDVVPLLRKVFGGPKKN